MSQSIRFGEESFGRLQGKMEGLMEKGVLDDIIRRLLEEKGGKQVQLSEAEIRQLCVNARQIFLSQPNLLRIRAPVRICGMSLLSLPISPLFIKIGYFCFHRSILS